jgi:hypothetical protein
MAIKAHPFPRYVFLTEEGLPFEFPLEPEGQEFTVISTACEFEEFTYSWGEFPTGGAEKRVRPVIIHTLRKLST